MLNSQDFISITSKYVRISPIKINRILTKIRGKTYKEALNILKYLPQKAGTVTWKALYSVVCNACKNSSVEKENLVIIAAYANHGPMLKRMMPRAKGRAFKIQKRVSHVTIRLSENIKK